MGFHGDLQRSAADEVKARQLQRHADCVAWFEAALPSLRALVEDWFAQLAAPIVPVQYCARVLEHVTYRYKDGMPSTTWMANAVWVIEGYVYWACVSRDSLGRADNRKRDVSRVLIDHPMQNGDFLYLPANDTTQLLSALKPTEHLRVARTIPSGLRAEFPGVIPVVPQFK